MAEGIKISIDREDDPWGDHIFNIHGEVPAAARHLLSRAIKDIAKRIEETAAKLAPASKDTDEDAYSWRSRRSVTGRFKTLKEHATERVVIKAVGTNLVEFIEISLPETPIQALFVHNGTAPYLAHNASGYMRYKSKGAWHRVKEVQGQAANPYLIKAVDIVEAGYLDTRVALLREEIRAIT